MLYSAIILGLISSLHCMGMCGPIAMMLPFSRSNPEKKALQLLTYHGGRIFSYAAIGLLFGFIGRGLYLSGFQQKISIIAGIAMIVVALLPAKGLGQLNLSGPIFKIVSALKNTLGSQFGKQSFSAIFSIGLLNGLLPCGMVYAALFGALAMHDVVLGSIYMALFGLGTIPMMSVVVYLQQFVTLPVRKILQRTLPYAVVVIGAFFIIRGLGLGIPYLSPAVIDLHVKALPDCH